MPKMDYNSSSSSTPAPTAMRALFGRFVDPDIHPWLKTMVAALGWVFGSITLSNVVLFATLLLTVSNLFFLIRDKWWRDPVRQRNRRRRK